MGQEAFHVFGEDIDFEIYGVARGHRADICVRVGERDDGDAGDARRASGRR